MFHNFIDSKQAFDRDWNAGQWQVFRSFKIKKGLVQAILAPYENPSSAVLLNSQLREFFTTAGVRQKYSLSPIMFNLLLEKIMRETLYDHHTSISLGGRPICNLRFVNDIDLIADSSVELKDLTN